MATAEQVRTLLRTTWHRLPDECTALPGGITAANWSVTVGGEPYLVKIVPAAHRSHLEAGLAAAGYLADKQTTAERSGLAGPGPAGRQSRQSLLASPVRAVDGGLVGSIGDEVAVVLHGVPGRPLDGADPVDRQWWGDALGTAHRNLSGFRHAGLARFHSVRADAPHLGVTDRLRPAVAAAVAAVRKLCVTDQLTYGVLHGDPVPSAFRLDPLTGRLGLVDWGPVASGPLTYDLAAAVVSAGGAAAARDLVDAYLAAGPVPPEEVEAALPTMVLFRWAVQADHLARQLAKGRRAGPGRAAGNGAAGNGAAGNGATEPLDGDRVGLEAARLALADLVEELRS